MTEHMGRKLNHTWGSARLLLGSMRNTRVLSLEQLGSLDDVQGGVLRVTKPDFALINADPFCLVKKARSAVHP